MYFYINISIKNKNSQDFNDYYHLRQFFLKLIFFIIY